MTMAVTSKGHSLPELLKMENVKKRFMEVTGKNPSAFTSALLSVFNSNELLKKCEPNSILTAAVMAASLDLQINPSLSEAYIVPYGNKATFQMSVHGYVQLALRTGQYKRIHAGVIREGEIRGVNPLTGELELGEKISEEVVGYVAHFELVNGFEKTLYMTREEVEAHAREYSQSYGYDVRSGKQNSIWSKNFDKMATKTVLKMLLKKWGVKSVEMQTAIAADAAVIGKETFTYVDNGESEVSHAVFEVGTDTETVAIPWESSNDSSE